MIAPRSDVVLPQMGPMTMHYYGSRIINCIIDWSIRMRIGELHLQSQRPHFPADHYNVEQAS